jgi:hypothetical protein
MYKTDRTTHTLGLTRSEICDKVIEIFWHPGGFFPGELTEVDPALFADKQNFSDLHFILGV